MQKPVRYYIVTNDERPVVRPVPVAVPRQGAPRPVVAETAGPKIADRPESRGERPRGVARLVRVAMRRRGHER